MEFFLRDFFFLAASHLFLSPILSSFLISEALLQFAHSYSDMRQNKEHYIVFVSFKTVEGVVSCRFLLTWLRQDTTCDSSAGTLLATGAHTGTDSE